MWMICVAAAVLAVLTQATSASDCAPNYARLKGHTACLDKSKKAISFEMTDAVRKTILDRHNFWRARAAPNATNMMKMSWDNELEMLAQKWADACDVRGGIHHDTLRFIPAGMGVGQNLHGGTLNFTASIDNWWVEGRSYPYGADFLHFYYNNKWGIYVGHYTQMAWALSYKIGCAAATCKDHYYQEVIVCNYGTIGNILPFKKPYETGKKCSMCKNCTEEGLCDCGDIHCNGGYINPATCQCDCTIDHAHVGFQTGPDCKLKCEGTKDIWYCGRPAFKDCRRGDVNHKCPHLCGNCP